MRLKTCLLLAMLLSGCAFPATKDGMVVRGFTAPRQTEEKIFVKEATGGSMTLPFWMSKIPNDNFTEAVRDSLLSSRAFSAESRSWGDDWGLEIEILDLDQPWFGLDMTVKTAVRYSLYLKGTKVHETIVRESATATLQDSFFGIQRMRLANEFSARANVKKFIAELPFDKIDLQRATQKKE